MDRTTRHRSMHVVSDAMVLPRTMTALRHVQAGFASQAGYNSYDLAQMRTRPAESSFFGPWPPFPLKAKEPTKKYTTPQLECRD
jgi:hypothetical protein